MLSTHLAMIQYEMLSNLKNGTTLLAFRHKWQAV